MTTTIFTTGVPFDEEWSASEGHICEGKSDAAETAVPDADSADDCRAACMKEVQCAGVTYHPRPDHRAGVDHKCYLALQGCEIIADGIQPSATVYLKPEPRSLDMAQVRELMNAAAVSYLPLVLCWQFRFP